MILLILILNCTRLLNPYLDIMESILGSEKEPEEEEEDQNLEQFLGYPDPGFASKDVYNQFKEAEECFDSDDENDDYDKDEVL